VTSASFANSLCCLDIEVKCLIFCEHSILFLREDSIPVISISKSSKITESEVVRASVNEKIALLSSCTVG
jgi:hypothetical protein